MRQNQVFLLTNSADVTSDYLQQRMLDAGLPVHRFNTDNACNNMRVSYHNDHVMLDWEGGILSSDSVSCVIVRRPRSIELSNSMDEVTREHTIDEWSEVVEGFLSHIQDDRWINHPANNFRASHKIEQLTRAKRYGIRIPKTIVTNSPVEATEFCGSIHEGIIVKPMASGYIERDNGDTVIYTNEININHCAINAIKECPVMFQQKIDKTVDVRVTVIDDKVIPIALMHKDETGLQELDVRRNNMSNVTYNKIAIPKVLQNKLTALIKSYHLRFAAVDFGVTKDGRWYFFEINPNGQWAWLDFYAEAGIADSFISIMKSLVLRLTSFYHCSGNQSLCG